MSQVTFNNGDSLATVRSAINGNATDAESRLSKLETAYTIVESVSDLPAAVGGVITLSTDDVAYLITGTVDLGSDKIVITGDGVVFEGISNQSIITSTTSDIMISSDKDLVLENVRLSATSSSCVVSVDNASINTLFLDRTEIIGSASGDGLAASNYNNVLINLCGFSGMQNGIVLSNTVNNLTVTLCAFTGISGINLDLGTAELDAVSISDSVCTLEATGTFIDILPDSGNLTGSQSGGTITSNKIDNANAGTISVGYSPLDIKWGVINNTGMIDSDRVTPGGFGYYADDNTGGAIVAGDGPENAVQFTINGLGGATDTADLPSVIQGTGQLWDTSANEITPIFSGDQYTVRVAFDITDTQSNPSYISLGLDIGIGTFPSIRVYEDSRTLKGGGFPQTYTFSIPIFCRDTFIANGGRFFVYCNSGTADVENRQVLISRTGSGAK